MSNFRLKELREEKGVTQDAVAKYLGCAQQSVNNYENRGNQPDIDTLIKLAIFFDTSVDYLIGFSDARYKYQNSTQKDDTSYIEDITLRAKLVPPEVRKSILDIINLFIKNK